MGATHYRLYSANTENGTYTQIHAGAATTYIHTGLAPNTTRYYTLAACHDATPATCSAQSAPRSATTFPAVPDGPTATPTATTVELSWNAIDGATHYRLYSASMENGTYNQIHAGAATAYIHTGLAPNTTRYYKLAACRDATPATCSAQSDPSNATTFPAVPDAPTATPKATTVELSWNAIDGATHYRLYSASMENGTYTQIHAGAATAYIHTGLAPNTTRYYKLAACRDATPATCSAQSDPSNATTFPAVPDAPTATPTATTVELSWSTVEGATHYRLYSANMENGTYAQIHAGAATAYIHTGLAPNTTRYYKLAACRDATPATCSAQSAPRSATTFPAVPDGPTATPTATTVELSWNAIDGATHYRLYSANMENGTYTQIHAGAATAYIHTGLAPNTTRYYTLAACHDATPATCSAQSAPSRSATTFPAVPDAPTATPTATTVELSWSTVEGATHYRLYSASMENGTYTQIHAGAATTYIHTGLEPATDYYYRLAACATAERHTCSAQSSIVRHTTTANTPRGLTATVMRYDITVSWNAVEGATRYRVYRSASFRGPLSEIHDGPETSYVDMDLNPFTQARYQVVACVDMRSQTCSPRTGIVTARTVPALPTSLNAIPTSTTVQLSWDGIFGANHYRLYASNTADGDYTQILMGGQGQTSYRHTDLETRTDYYYRLAACDTTEINTCSAQSNPPIKATTTVMAPAAPTATLTGTTANLAWEMATGITHYEVWRGTHAGGTDRVLLTGGSGQPAHPDMNTLSFSDPHVGSTATWYYWLRGCDAEGCSDFSGRSDPLNYADGVHLNDTGINFGGNVSGNASDCTSDIVGSDGAMIPQDCSQGRDGEAAASSLPKTGGGVAGYDFTRLDAEGIPLDNQTASWAERYSIEILFGETPHTHWACVRDNHTGLVWEVKTTASGIHNQDERYAWGGVTAEGRDSTLAGKGVYSDDWNRLVEGSNSGNGLCGLTNWRAPTIKELTSIARARSTDPAMEPFPNLPRSNVSLWSATPVAGGSSSTSTTAWGMNQSGNDAPALRSSEFALRLVSGEWEGVDDEVVTSAGGQTHRGWIANRTPDSRYTVDMTNGTVIDTETGLMWQRCAQGLTGNNCTGSATPLNWQGALALAGSSEFASYSDWRLPNIEELRSLVAYDRHGPAINTTIFPTTTGAYWSSSPSSRMVAIRWLSISLAATTSPWLVPRPLQCRCGWYVTAAMHRRNRLPRWRAQRRSISPGR